MIFLNRKAYPYQEEVNEGIVRYFPENRGASRPRVLDVGCGRGILGGALKARGYEVWGIENHPEAIPRAVERLDHVIPGDLNDFGRVEKALSGQTFDALVFSDVLEHLYDPLTVLQAFLVFLNPGGKLYISVPNIAVWEFRLKLVLGIFRYQDAGVLDRTHLRFFTYRTAKELVKAAHCQVQQVDCTPYLVRAFLPLIKRLFVSSDPSLAPENASGALSESSWYRFYMRAIYPLEYALARLCKSLFAFRIIIVSQKISQSGDPDHGPS